ncbi:MAG: aldehyde dehydrogenase family protein, partial [Pirellula sp.]
MSRKIDHLWFDPVPWIDGRSIKRLPNEQVTNPATGEIVSPVAFAECSDVEQAIRSCQRAQDQWEKTSAFERGEILKRVAEKLESQRDLLARLLTTEQGKAYLQALGEVDYAASFFRWFGEEARRVCGRIAPHPQADREFLVEHKPLGIAAWITPWNFP